MRSLFVGILYGIFLLESGSAAAVNKIYQMDVAPLQAEHELASQYNALQDKFQTEALTQAEHQKRMVILKEVLAKHPDWLDGYWLVAADAFFLGSSYTDPKDHPLARTVLKDGEASINECLHRSKDNLLCRFFQASIKAKIASIDGIFASLRQGQSVRDTWQEVVNSGIDMSFRPNVSLQGSAHYGLGLFYRLVPNFFLMDWLFHIRGNIDESIRLHREALHFDGGNPCYQLMLSVSLLCKVKGNPQTQEYAEAMKLLEEPAHIKPVDLAQAVCVHDVAKIRSQPKHTCGYTQAKYQDDVKENDLNK